MVALPISSSLHHAKVLGGHLKENTGWYSPQSVKLPNGDSVVVPGQKGLYQHVFNLHNKQRGEFLSKSQFENTDELLAAYAYLRSKAETIDKFIDGPHWIEDKKGNCIMLIKNDGLVHTFYPSNRKKCKPKT